MKRRHTITFLVIVVAAGLFRVARRFFGGNVGFIAAALAALNPFLILMSGYLLTENIYMVLVMTAPLDGHPHAVEIARMGELAARAIYPRKGYGVPPCQQASAAAVDVVEIRAVLAA